MLKKIRRFFREYKQLGWVILGIIVGAGLDLAGYDTAAHFVLGTSAVLNLMPLLWGMWQAFRDGIYGLNILAATAIVTAVLLGEYWAGMVIVLMLTGSKVLEDFTERRAKKELGTLLERKPKKATVVRGKKTLEVRVSEIIVGDKVLVSPGQVVPVDGIIVEGSSSFDESSMTGEGLPRAKETDDHVMSGSVNMEGLVTIKALRTAHDSHYEQIIKLVRTAAASQAPFVRLADRYSIPFTLLSFMVAGSVWFVSGDPVRFLEVLVVATPFPLLLGAPIALTSGISRASKHGIIVKTGSALERLAEVQTVAFDKTGILTRGEPVVDGIKTYNKFTKQQVLEYASALEYGSNHILAKAITSAASSQKTKLTPAKHIQEKPGYGITGRLGGKTIVVGRALYMQEAGVELPETATTLTKTTASFVAVDGKLAGVIQFIDESRPESQDMLNHLQKLRVKNTLLVTGDNQAAADSIAKQLGIDKVIADCLPGDKIRALESVNDRPVAFVGDGMNDAHVLTAADIGIAMGTFGSTTASESGDVVIMTHDITKVASSVAIAKRTFRIAKQSILIGIFISIGLMGIFATGRFKAVHGAAIQELVDIAVISNALRARRSGRKL